ncbi:HAMP domain-containing sensor histidine kinase [Streptomyces sp. NPDC046716]|uniref:HAMP domain-containing sensor histidine kinase n=1 Tax=Streptomyces sp. NPDC046716 TaxID=3157093 RepID=UPI0033D4D6CB
MKRWRTRPRTLRTRLVVSAIALIAVVAAVIGTVTTVAVSSSLYERLDSDLASIAKRAKGPGDMGRVGQQQIKPPDLENVNEDLGWVVGGGSPNNTVGAILKDGEVATSVRGLGGSNTADLTGTQQSELAAVSRDGRTYRVDLTGLGTYRVTTVQSQDGDWVIVGIPATQVQDTVQTLILVELSVTFAGLVAAGIAGAVMVGVNLRPLRRVAATATRVSEIPLHTGEVTLYERVPDAEADPRTEVGQVGAALNRMLDHIHGALHSRQQSEMRVRQFVADASHELRTPLASIRGYAELTRRGREDVGPDTRHALSRIESEAHRMTGLVEDLLLLARLDAGRPLSYEPTDLSPLVIDVLSDARAAGQDHKWRLELPDEPALVLADSARLQQVLVNLLANARTHTPPGTTVTARVHRHGPWVCVDVRDDGPGIPAELLPHVFERFARGDSSRSRKAGSTGLGLAIVQAVAAAHGGAVTVDSVPGRTVFTVHLPAYDEPVSALPAGADALFTHGQRNVLPNAQSDSQLHSQAAQRSTTQR